jgi:hypothetical protein
MGIKVIKFNELNRGGRAEKFEKLEVWALAASRQGYGWGRTGADKEWARWTGTRFIAG